MAMPGWVQVADPPSTTMRVTWLIAAGYQLDPALDLDRIKAIGPVWGSWKTWRGCQTDNVVCHDLAKARELIARAFQAVCNFHVPKAMYQDLNRPVGVRLYEGEYLQETWDIEDIVAGHLASQNADIVLMLGYDFRRPEAVEDRLVNHKNQNRHGLLFSMIRQAENTQWVLVDHAGEMDKSYTELTNLTCDTMANALNLLV